VIQKLYYLLVRVSQILVKNLWVLSQNDQYNTPIVFGASEMTIYDIYKKTNIFTRIKDTGEDKMIKFFSNIWQLFNKIL
jgi:hypothetical protein